MGKPCGDIFQKFLHNNTTCMNSLRKQRAWLSDSLLSFFLLANEPVRSISRVIRVKLSLLDFRDERDFRGATLRRLCVKYRTTLRPDISWLATDIPAQLWLYDHPYPEGSTWNGPIWDRMVQTEMDLCVSFFMFYYSPWFHATDHSSSLFCLFAIRLFVSGRWKLHYLFIHVFCFCFPVIIAKLDSSQGILRATSWRSPGTEMKVLDAILTLQRCLCLATTNVVLQYCTYE